MSRHSRISISEANPTSPHCFRHSIDTQLLIFRWVSSESKNSVETNDSNFKQAFRTSLNRIQISQSHRVTFFFKPIHSLRLLGHLPRLSKSLAFVNSATHSKLHLLPLLVFLMFSSSDPCLSLGGQTPSSASDILFVTEPAPSACQLLTSTLAGWRLSSPTSFASISQLLGLPILGEKHTFLSELPPDSGRLPTTRERATV